MDIFLAHVAEIAAYYFDSLHLRRLGLGIRHLLRYVSGLHGDIALEGNLVQYYHRIIALHFTVNSLYSRQSCFTVREDFKHM